MTKRIAIANRKGGVGKSTITMSIAYALAAWEHQKVLVVDLDTQCNVSQALIGGQRWSELRKGEQLISDYFFSILDEDFDRLKDRQQFVAQDVGEVKFKHGSVALLPGSLEFGGRAGRVCSQAVSLCHQSHNGGLADQGADQIVIASTGPFI